MAQTGELRLRLLNRGQPLKTLRDRTRKDPTNSRASNTGTDLEALPQLPAETIPVSGSCARPDAREFLLDATAHTVRFRNDLDIGFAKIVSHTAPYLVNGGIAPRLAPRDPSHRRDGHAETLSNRRARLAPRQSGTHRHGPLLARKPRHDNLSRGIPAKPIR